MGFVFVKFRVPFIPYLHKHLSETWANWKTKTTQKNPPRHERFSWFQVVFGLDEAMPCSWATLEAQREARHVATWAADGSGISSNVQISSANTWWKLKFNKETNNWREKSLVSIYGRICDVSFIHKSPNNQICPHLPLHEQLIEDQFGTLQGGRLSSRCWVRPWANSIIFLMQLWGVTIDGNSSCKLVFFK